MNEPLPKDSLLPCPWCGGDNLETFLTREADGVIEYVQCMDCTSCGPDHKEGRHWNKQPAMVAISRLRGAASTCLSQRPTSGQMRFTLEQIAGLEKQ
jgi:hypothetical protein